MNKILKTDLVDTYFLAMMLKGYSLEEIGSHLGYCRSVGTARLNKLEKVYKTDLTKKCGRLRLLTPAGCDVAVKCLTIIDLLVPDYTEPKIRGKIV